MIEETIKKAMQFQRVDDILILEGETWNMKMYWVGEELFRIDLSKEKK